MTRIKQLKPFYSTNAITWRYIYTFDDLITFN